MSPATKNTNAKSPRAKMLRSRRSIRWILVCLALCAVGFGGTAWKTLSDLKMSRELAVAEKRMEIARRTKLKEQQAEEERLAELAAERQASDESDQEERRKWTAVIDQLTAALETGRALARRPAMTSTGFAASNERESATTVEAGNQSHDARAADDTKEAAEIWSLERLSRVDVPQLNGDAAEWARNPIDRFVAARQQAAGLSPNQEASRAVLARRLWYDTLGLPPQPEEVEAFVAANSPQAYENVVERLLQRPEFGERWARVWLDLARYADSNGYEEDELREHAYPYRDFVIWAMNVDLPFDDFVRWQIAGDELAPHNPLAVAATGFFTAAPLNTFIPQPSERFDELDDMVATMGTAMMGLSVGCARCHDHMYDPISTAEYYRLVAVFAETERTQSFLTADGGREYRKFFDPVDERRQEIWQLRRDRVIEDNIADLDHFNEEEKNLLRQPIDPDNEQQQDLIANCERCLFIMKDQVSDDLEPLPKDKARFDQLQAELKELEAKLPVSPPIGLTLSGSSISRTHVLDGGDLKRAGEEVGPGFLSAATAGEVDWEQNAWRQWGESSGPRSALANWMTDVDRGAGPLVARVIVNRLWQHHFGQGLVRTSSDFGTQGEEPSHPELLEWLATELVDNGWSLKHIHRLILNSATYRQSAMSSEQQRRLDPENRLLSRRRPQRLSAEMMRDAMLQVAGNLNRDMYGPGVQPPIPREAVYNTQDEPEETWPCDTAADRPEVWRRSIYVMLKRTVPVPMLRLFDAPDGSFSCSARKQTTVPTQTLALWNARFVTEQSRRLAERIIAETENEEEQVERLFWLTISRPPTPQEKIETLSFLWQPEPGELPDANNAARQRHQQQRLAELCHVLLMSNEFSYVN